MIIVKVKRPDGRVEEIETNKIPFAQHFLNKAYEDTKSAGRTKNLKLLKF